MIECLRLAVDGCDVDSDELPDDTAGECGGGVSVGLKRSLTTETSSIVF